MDGFEVDVAAVGAAAGELDEGAGALRATARDLVDAVAPLAGTPAGFAGVLALVDAAGDGERGLDASAAELAAAALAADAAALEHRRTDDAAADGFRPW